MFYIYVLFELVYLRLRILAVHSKLKRKTQSVERIKIGKVNISCHSVEMVNQVQATVSKYNLDI